MFRMDVRQPPRLAAVTERRSGARRRPEDYNLDRPVMQLPWLSPGRGRLPCGNFLGIPHSARPDTRYWHDHIAGRSVVFFLRGRLRFDGGGAQGAPFPSALAVWGASPETLDALDAVLREAWRVR